MRLLLRTLSKCSDARCLQQQSRLEDVMLVHALLNITVASSATNSSSLQVLS
jgi:hypothetical protein